LVKKSIFILLILCLGIFSQAQDIDWENPNFRTRSIIASDTLFILDTLAVIPNKISVKDKNNQIISPGLYSFDSRTNTCTIDPSLLNDSLYISYYLYPGKKEKIVFSKDTSLIESINKPPKLY
jgi:hypothetical protein